MFVSLSQFIKRLVDWYTVHRKHFILRIVRGSFSIAVLGLCIWIISQKLVEGLNYVINSRISFDPIQIIIAWICIFGGIVLGAWEWILLVESFGGELNHSQGFYIHLTSNLAKYLPGSIWTHTGRIYLAIRSKVPANVAVLSVVCEFFIIHLTGVMLLLLCLPYSGIVRLSGSTRLLLQLSSFLLAGVTIMSAPWVIEFVIKKSATLNIVVLEDFHIDHVKFSFAMFCIMLTWFLVGWGFSRLDPSVSQDTWQRALRFVIALIAAVLIGQIAFFAPLGVGVREAVLVTLLSPVSPAAIVLLIAVVFRLESLVAESLGALLVIFWNRIHSLPSNNP